MIVTFQFLMIQAEYNSIMPFKNSPEEPENCGEKRNNIHDKSMGQVTNSNIMYTIYTLMNLNLLNTVVLLEQGRYYNIIAENLNTFRF